MPLSRRSFLAASVSLPVVSALPSTGCAEPGCFAGLIVTDTTDLPTVAPVPGNWTISVILSPIDWNYAQTDRLASILPRSDG